MRIVSWNINSIRARAENFTDFCRRVAPDAICLQEIKCQNQDFPHHLSDDCGFNAYVNGQKSYNGVSILSKSPLEDVSLILPGDEADVQARFIEGKLIVRRSAIRLINGYFPNGNPIASEKYEYKISWLRRLLSLVKEAMKNHEDFILCGDFNIIPEEIDVKNPQNWQNDALFQPEVRQIYREFLYLGLTDAVRSLHPAQAIYSFWDYQGGARRKNDGIRIDHFLLSPRLADRLIAAEVIDTERDTEKASDHAPVMIEIQTP
jgi:exodeoxyribonuclease III